MNNADKEIMLKLATRWMELASLPVMAERRRLWTALHDLHGERPMVLFETDFLENYVANSELECADTFLREVEKQLRWVIRHAEEVGDDVVVEPFYRVYWDIEATDYGVPLQAEHASDMLGGDVAYVYEHPIHTPADISKLRPRAWCVNQEKILRRHAQLQECFGDILPVELHGVSSLLVGLTQDLFKLIGNDNLMQWTYDEPAALHRIMAYLRDDRMTYYNWLERSGWLGYNHTGWELAGSGSPGYTTGLPQADAAGQARLRDMWVWMESQETTTISPRMFGEFFLPYMADACRCFGLVYYGCCEPVHDRWDMIVKAIPNIRAVSVSPWCDQNIMAHKLGREYVFSRKPKPWLITGHNPDWDALRMDARDTVAAARECNLEIIFRDVYRIGDRSCLQRWTDIVRSTAS
jgi:hypothetical protein